VEVAGIEPASIGDDSRLLRAQPLLRVLDLLVSCGPASNTVKVTVYFPHALVTRAIGDPSCDARS